MKGSKDRAETVSVIKTQILRSCESDGAGNFCESTNRDRTDYTSIWANDMVDNPL